jgi:hypothetical protein
MTMKGEDGETCAHCTITIIDGYAHAEYQWVGLLVPGRDRHDEDVSDWSDDEVREVVGGLIGITEGFADIKVNWS